MRAAAATWGRDVGGEVCGRVGVWECVKGKGSAAVFWNPERAGSNRAVRLLEMWAAFHFWFCRSWQREGGCGARGKERSDATGPRL